MRSRPRSSNRGKQGVNQVKNDAETFRPLGPPIRKEQPNPPAPVVKKQTNNPLPPVHINDMDMIRKDYGNIPPPWGLFKCRTAREAFYFSMLRFKDVYFRGDEQ